MICMQEQNEPYRTVREELAENDELTLRRSFPLVTEPSSAEGHSRVVGELLLRELDRVAGMPPIIYGVDDRISVELDRYRDIISEDEFYLVAKEAEYGDTDGDIDIGVFHVNEDTVAATHIEAKSYPVTSVSEKTADQIESFHDHADRHGWDVETEIACYDDASHTVYRCAYDAD